MRIVMRTLRIIFSLLLLVFIAAALEHGNEKQFSYNIWYIILVCCVWSIANIGVHLFQNDESSFLDSCAVVLKHWVSTT